MGMISEDARVLWMTLGGWGPPCLVPSRWLLRLPGVLISNFHSLAVVTKRVQSIVYDFIVLL